jgi:cellulose synthase/poly-beta-1,6-N-acetylglucosamine synthase-like glycosyltransferase
MSATATGVLLVLFVITQVFYLLVFFNEAYLFSLPTNWVDEKAPRPATLPEIVLFYPVLNEAQNTMRTTLLGLANMDYPSDRYRVIAISNWDDPDTFARLRGLQAEFPFLEVLVVPQTSDPRWQVVWDNWDQNRHAYWWHRDATAYDRNLPAKKTRQLIYAFYRVAAERGNSDFLVNYIDADSVPPPDHFLHGAVGMQQYDVLQSTNVAGNLLDSLSASFHAFDHMTWDGRKYPHLSADGRQPFWVLGKGLFFRAADLLELGGFHPWVTIEDPEVGMRLWKNGRRLGIIRGALIEEVPNTFAKGVTQRKRWVCGFFQSLTRPLDHLGFTRGEKFRAWLNFTPCLSQSVNAIGIPVGIWALVAFFTNRSQMPLWTVLLALLNIALFVITLGGLYVSTWRRTALVLDSRAKRLWYMLRINPLFLWGWWLFWTIPLVIGWSMFRKNGGLVWERTHKVDANAQLVRKRLGDGATVMPAE